MFNNVDGHSCGQSAHPALISTKLQELTAYFQERRQNTQRINKQLNIKTFIHRHSCFFIVPINK